MGRTIKIITVCILLLGVGAALAIGLMSKALDLPSGALGTWRYRIGSSESCIDVLADGTYTERILQGSSQVLRHSSEWSIDKIGINKVITFKNFQHISDDAQSIRSPGLWPVGPRKNLITGSEYLQISDDENRSFIKSSKSCE